MDKKVNQTKYQRRRKYYIKKSREYYAKNRIRMINWNKLYYKKHKNRLNYLSQKRRGTEGSNAWWQKRFNRVKRSAEERGILFKLSLSQYIKIRTKWSCVYCGSKDKFSVDRKNNNKGYLKDNILASCFRCNLIKSNRFSFEEMLMIGKVLKKIDKIKKPR